MSMHNCIHFVNGKQLGRILSHLLLGGPMSPPCIPLFDVCNSSRSSSSSTSTSKTSTVGVI